MIGDQVLEIKLPYKEILRVLNNHHDSIEEVQNHILQLKDEISKLRGNLK
jgi:endonuclease/exonuclease/phosphatase (EEP) superfamily protein YafD